MARSSRSHNGTSTISRRRLLLRTAHTAGVFGFAAVAGWISPERSSALGTGADGFGALQPPDANGLMLPPGFSSRVVGVSGKKVGKTAYRWHKNPDGGATFATEDGGWIYVSNSETLSHRGGVSAIRFTQDGTIVDAYSILRGTNRNCAGGPTPWGAWLSCEETPSGRVFECDPFAKDSLGSVVAGLGIFRHEAVAVDAIHQTVYLTEDEPDGLLYRFTPSQYPDLQSGTLEAAEILDSQEPGPITPGQKRALAWHTIANPNPKRGGVRSSTHQPLDKRATRYQAPNATLFDGGEGCWIRDHRFYFATKGDSRVWVLDTNRDQIEIFYDAAASLAPTLTDLDNVFVGESGDVYVAEDPGDLQIVALTASGNVKPVVQLVGQHGTELTGPAITSDGSRLYFSSQRNPGITYEVRGPFWGD